MCDRTRGIILPFFGMMLFSLLALGMFYIRTCYTSIETVGCDGVITMYIVFFMSSVLLSGGLFVRALMIAIGGSYDESSSELLINA